jgi:endonuclease/exonuclease/phosphatase family metal-dependent hydrolase
MKLKIMSLNIMHARRKGKTSLPLAYKKAEIVKNTKQIAEQIKKADPDIVGLQEVDGPSLLNGGYDQLAEIQRYSGYPYAYFAPHSLFKRKSKTIHEAGTAILSKHPLVNPRTAFFSRTFPIPRKGYAVSDILLPNGAHMTFVSVHLVLFDIGRTSARSRQSRHMVKHLAGGPHPIVITGDMNCSAKRESTIPNLMKGLDLHAYEVDSPHHKTFPAWKPRRRIDWILPSKNFRFLNHTIYHDIATDHAGVLAHLVLE